ncbi:MAG: hypothetical protein F6K39_45225, partial [Okeania sp. SIO3B3]|nr:hypothetical protein [Okeania sp. SIO3B3]
MKGYIEMSILSYAIDRIKNVEILTSQTNSHSVVFESDSFKTIESSQSQGMGLRTIYKDNIGFSFSNNLDDKELIDQAIESAQFGEKAHFTFAEQKDIEDYNIYDDEVNKTPTELMLDMGKEIIETIKKENSDIKVDVELEKRTSQHSLTTSNGFSQEYKKSFFSVGVSGLIAKNDQILSIYKAKTRLSPFTDTKELTQPILEKFKLSSNISAIQSGNFPVLFTPRAVKFLASILTSSLNGKMIQKQISPLSEKVGESILATNFTLIDDGTIKKGLTTSPFDGEGTL